MRREGNPGDRQTPGIHHSLVEFDPVVMLGHVVDDHRHGHRFARRTRQTDIQRVEVGAFPA